MFPLFTFKGRVTLGHSTTTATQWTPRVNYPVRFQQDEEGNPLVIVQDSKPLLSNTYIGHFHPKKKKKKNTKQARNWGKKSDFFPSNLKSQPPSHLAISVRHDFHLHLLSIVHLLKMPFFWSELERFWCQLFKLSSCIVVNNLVGMFLKKFNCLGGVLSDRLVLCLVMTPILCLTLKKFLTKCIIRVYLFFLQKRYLKWKGLEHSL